MDRGEDPPLSHREIGSDKCCRLDGNIVVGDTDIDAVREIILHEVKGKEKVPIIPGYPIL